MAALCRKVCSLVALLVAACPAVALATPVLTASVGGLSTGPFHANFDNLALGNAGGATNPDITVSFTGDAQVVFGNGSGYAAPYLDGNGGPFGNPSGPDTTPYLSTGIGSVTLTFTAPQTYLGFLWGSADLYNHLTLYDASGEQVATFSGADVNAAADGDQGAAGTFYVNISNLPVFKRAVFTSDDYAFEFDNVSYDVDPPAGVPEPMTVSLLGAYLIGAGFMRRSRLHNRPVSARIMTISSTSPSPLPG